MNRCNVANCDFLAESAIEDFAVCALHDHQATVNILYALQRPGAYWMSGHPIVLPCGPLEEKHLVPVPARPGDVRAGDATDHLMTNIPDGPAPCHPAYDLSL